MTWEQQKTTRVVGRGDPKFPTHSMGITNLFYAKDSFHKVAGSFRTQNERFFDPFDHFYATLYQFWRELSEPSKKEYICLLTYVFNPFLGQLTMWFPVVFRDMAFSNLLKKSER